MRDFSQLLADKVDVIAQQWVDRVIRDGQVKSTEHLTRQAVLNHIGDVLTALATVLAQTEESDFETIAQASFKHGALRAKQDFDPREVVREYHLLRTTILANVSVELLQGTAEEVLRAMSLIDAVVDSAIAQCFHSYVEERLQELQQVQHQLSLTIEELQRLVNANQDNISHLAHELKTPLSSIINYSDLFLRQSRKTEIRDTATSLTHIERVLANGRKLLTLINDSLELSRCEAGKIPLNVEPTNVPMLINTVSEIMEPLASSRGLQLLVDYQNLPNQVMTDGVRLQQILMNLVSNAIRYTEVGSISIVCRLISPQEWSILVEDTGIGIAAKDHLRIFQPFERAIIPGKNHPADSTGLGLAIVDKLVHLLQGRIYLSSEVGKGSTFTVIFPIEIKSNL
ncbi:HAMP domain-containing sensor histidine kinase [Calothrix sp. UHCC 0171]|uniref:sensor histidine kinase n=1 Tax=Calothrix sp. UHCC 0171 TaxID=3110245 RepID=UPI002B1E97F8|nr:HAMP domain-containing sensor histidine kinase [Calothrix sp. UHCC 0171]MEA5574274.1 HAMP domain-containing sensor histidine kinase [Calothrix sp. UHCC 0171]